MKECWLIDPEARTVEVLFLERGACQLVGRWQPDGQAVSRLLNGFKVPVRELLGSAVKVKDENSAVGVELRSQGNHSLEDPATDDE